MENKRNIIRLFCITLCIVLPASAFAIGIDHMIAEHNLNCSIFGGQKLNTKPDKIDKDKGAYTFNVNEKLIDVFFTKNGDVSGFGCICRDVAQEGEFLAQCVAACYSFAGDKAGETCFDVILSQFLFARGGQELSKALAAPGLYVQMSKTQSGYIFTSTKVE